MPLGKPEKRGLFGRGLKLVVSGQWIVKSVAHRWSLATKHWPLMKLSAAALRGRVFPVFGLEGKEIAGQPPTVQTPLAHCLLDKTMG